MMTKEDRMAEFKKVVNAKRRMCKAFRCDKCPIGNHNISSVASCTDWMLSKPEEAESIIMKWARENPLMTNRMKFKEVFGFEFTDRVPESQYHREWLDEEYERK